MFMVILHLFASGSDMEVQEVLTAYISKHKKRGRQKKHLTHPQSSALCSGLGKAMQEAVL